jgi:4-hydroxy-4-methyl-2-oxoglutarate aldolase
MIMDKPDNRVTRRNAFLAAAGGAGVAALAAGATHASTTSREYAACSQSGAFRDTARDGLGGPYKIVRDIPRPTQAQYDRLTKAGAAYPVAVAGPLAMGAQLALNPGLKPIRPHLRICGPAFTVKAHDHLIPMYAMQMAKPGDILVIDAGGWSSVCIWGGSMTWSATIRKLGGVVINGMVCDSSGLIGPDVNPIHKTPLFSLGATPAYTTWELPGSINVPIYFDGHRIEPGDLVLGDDDGVAIIPHAEIDTAITKAEAFQATVPAWHDPMRLENKTWFEALKLEGVIQKLNIPES